MPSEKVPTIEEAVRAAVVEIFASKSFVEAGFSKYREERIWGRAHLVDIIEKNLSARLAVVREALEEAKSECCAGQNPNCQVRFNIDRALRILGAGTKETK